VFAAGQFAPETPPGRRLLAHELAHVAQQAAAAPLPAGAGSGPVPVAAPGPAPASGVVQRAPDPAPQPDPQHPFLLKYKGQPDKDRWINLDDVEWSENYIDFNMITMQVTFIPGTNLDNIDHDRAKAIHIEYANGHIVDFPLDDIPLIKQPNPRGARVGRLDYYEMRDGMVYPIASGMVMYSPQNTPNLIGLRLDAYDRIEQLRQLALLRSLAGTFANLIAMSVGVLGTVHEMGGMGGVPGGGGRPRRGGTQTDPPDIGREIDEAVSRLPEEDPHSGAVRDPNSPIRSDVMVGGQPEAVGPSKGGVPAVKDPKAPPPELLDVGAGTQRTNLGVPPEHELVAVTRSDISPAGNPDVVLDATKPIPANLRGRFTTLMVNNPYGYKPNIGAMREALGPDGKIIVQGNWEANKYFRSLGTDPVPPGMTRTIERDLPPSAVLGGGFRTTSGERPVQPNARITFHVSH
jgi:hypothetical protein